MSFFSKTDPKEADQKPMFGSIGKVHTMRQDIEDAKKESDFPSKLLHSEEDISITEALPQRTPLSDGPFFASTTPQQEPNKETRRSHPVKPRESHSITTPDTSEKSSTAHQWTSQEPFNPQLIRKPPEDAINSQNRHLRTTESISRPLQELPKETLRTGTWPIGDEESPKTFDSSTSVKKKSDDANPLKENVVLEEPRKRVWLIASAIFLLLGFVSGGSYYFWSTRQIENTPEISTENIPPVEEKEPETVEESKLPFSTKNPNPFMVNVETETISTLQAQFLKDAETMKTASMGGPIPFSAVDKTNTPIAFFIFASIFNLGLSGNLLNSFENDFSLFLTIDKGSPKLAIAIKTKDIEIAKKHLLEEETTLPIGLKNLFLSQDISAPQTAAFGSGSYQNTAIRYFNIPNAENASIDYGFVGNTLVIGTSKDSARSVIDFIAKEEDSHDRN